MELSSHLISFFRFHEALSEQPQTVPIDVNVAKIIGLALFVVGGILVLSSYYRLGILGTYLGASSTRFNC